MLGETGDSVPALGKSKQIMTNEVRKERPWGARGRQLYLLFQPQSVKELQVRKHGN